MSDNQAELLLNTTDAMVWAEEFMKNFGNRLNEIDTGLMIGWFANAFAAQESKDGTSGYYSPESVSEIDRCARAYGWEVGRGERIEEVITTHPVNPFMNPNWREEAGLTSEGRVVPPEG